MSLFPIFFSSPEPCYLPFLTVFALLLSQYKGPFICSWHLLSFCRHCQLIYREWQDKAKNSIPRDFILGGLGQALRKILLVKKKNIIFNRSFRDLSAVGHVKVVEMSTGDVQRRQLVMCSRNS